MTPGRLSAAGAATHAGASPVAAALRPLLLLLVGLALGCQVMLGSLAASDQPVQAEAQARMLAAASVLCHGAGAPADPRHHPRQHGCDRACLMTALLADALLPPSAIPAMAAAATAAVVRFSILPPARAPPGRRDDRPPARGPPDTDR